MRRPIVLLTAALLGATALVAPAALGQQAAQPRPGWGKGLDYDIDKVRAAQKKAAEKVGPMPAHLQEYFKDKPAFGFHDRREDHAEHKKPVVLHTTPENYPAMQAQLQSYLATRYRTQAAEAAAAGEPMVFKVPTLLFQVNDTPFQQGATAQQFEDLMSGVGTSPTGTVTEMYLEQSFGNMVVDFDAFGPYTVSVSNTPATSCYYGTEGAPVTGTVFGIGGLGAKGMAAELVPQADPEIDFGEYDNDLDGIVDFLLIVHSGPDAAATGDPCHVWSHYFGPISEERIPTTDRNGEGEPVGVSATMTVPEVDLEIGVVAHELMHALGEPDYYGTAGTTGTGDWDLGAGGSWSGIPAQTNPVHFNPVMKINFSWIEPKRIDATALNQALRPRASNPDLLMVPLKIAKEGSEQAELCDQAPVGVPGQNRNFYTDDGDCLVEGYLIENVNRASAAFPDDDCTADAADFDRQLYGSGLMVWHWDFTNYESLGNDNVMRPMLDIEEFDRRDGQQELGTGLSRAQPLDPFWGDPVGMTGATQVAPADAGIDPPEDSPWTVTGPPTTYANVSASPQPTWTAPAAPQNTGMIVSLSWQDENDDWDLFVDKRVNGTWAEVGSATNGSPHMPEQVLVPNFSKGDEFRARAVNWLSLTSMSAEVSVSYTTVTATRFGPVGTRTNDLEQTGWAFTNLRPTDYRGLAHAGEQPQTEIVLDLVKHDETTVDVSGDFVRAVQQSPAPIVAGTPAQFSTVAYNHGGKPTAATVEIFDADPAAGGSPIAREVVQLGGFERRNVTFTHAPRLGANELYVRATAAGDVTPGNDVVRSELTAYPGGGDVLVVDNDHGWTQEQGYEAVLRSLGVRYDVVQGEPEVGTLRRYDAVIWLTTTVSGAQGVLSSAAKDDIARYLDADGRLWLSTTRAGGYDDGAWLGRYFGLEVTSNLLNSMGAWKGTGDAIGGEREIALGYLDGRPYLDYGRVSDAAAGEVTPLFTHSARPDDVFATKLDGTDGFRSVFGVVLGLVQDGAERVRLTREVLSFLGVPTGVAAQPVELTVHTERFQHVQPGADWPVTVGAFGRLVKGVDLVYRPYGGGDWSTLALTRQAPGVYTGTIPGADIGNQGLQYFVQVTGRGNKVTEVDGGASLPNVASAPYGDPVEAACSSTAGKPGHGKGTKA